MFQGANVSFDEFERDIWRTRSAVLGAINLQCLEKLEFEDLLALAHHELAESRLLTAQTSDSSFQLEFGPFVPEEFSRLERAEMLMVQNIESFLPEISSWLSEQFGFLPRWRIEDVMATLAHRGGNCGAHFDQYDVFLVQLSGKKHWQLDEGGHNAADLDTTSDVRLLRDFTPSIEHTLDVGQVLYIPPGVGHLGIASDNCITLSVGIRNPLLSEMAAYLADMLLQEIESENSLNDKLGGIEISTEEIEPLSDEVIGAIGDHGLMTQWFGRYMTEPRDPELIELPEEAPSSAQVTAFLNVHETVSLALPARIAVQTEILFINGEVAPLTTPARWLSTLQQDRVIATHSIPTEDLYLIEALLSAGALAILPSNLD